MPEVEVLLLTSISISIVSLLVVIALWARISRTSNQSLVDEISELLSGENERLNKTIRDEVQRSREESAVAAKESRAELSDNVGRIGKSLLDQTAELARQQKEQLEIFSGNLRRSAADSAEETKRQHETLLNSFKDIREQLLTQLKHQNEANAKAAESLKQGVENQMTTLRKENTEKLEQMRATVDEM